MSKIKNWYNELDENMQSSLVFCLVTFGAAWFLIFVAYITGTKTVTQGSAVVSAMMFMPLAGSIVTRMLNGDGFDEFRLKPKLRHNVFKYLVSYFLGPVLVLCGIAFYFFFVATDKVDVQATSYVTLLQETLSTADESVDFNTALAAFYTRTGMGFLFAPLLNVVFTLASELGWSGFLLQKMTNKFGTVKAPLFVGLLRSLWYVPLIVLGLNYGKGYGFYPWLGILLGFLFYTSLSVIAGYFALRTGCIVPSALFMSGVISSLDYGFYFIDIDKCSITDPEFMLVGPSAAGIVGMLLIILTAVMYLLRCRRMEWDAEEEKVTNVRGSRNPSQRKKDREAM